LHHKSKILLSQVSKLRTNSMKLIIKRFCVYFLDIKNKQKFIVKYAKPKYKKDLYD